jgi:hypothetical protein
MKAGLIAHSTETVATTAVTSAGIAATSENSATTRLCSRAPARAARRAARRLRNSRAISTSRQMTIKPSPTRIVNTTMGVGMIGVNPAKMTKVASARITAPPTAIGPKRPDIRPSPKRSAGPRPATDLASPCDCWIVTSEIFATVAVRALASKSGANATMLQDYDKMGAKLI